MTVSVMFSIMFFGMFDAHFASGATMHFLSEAAHCGDKFSTASFSSTASGFSSSQENEEPLSSRSTSATSTPPGSGTNSDSDGEGQVVEAPQQVVEAPKEHDGDRTTEAKKILLPKANASTSIDKVYAMIRKSKQHFDERGAGGRIEWIKKDSHWST